MTRKWFQIHLSTALVLMFAAGGLLWLNFHTPHRIWIDSFGTGNVIDYYDYGWPVSFFSCGDYTGKEAHSAEQVAIVEKELAIETAPMRHPVYRNWDYQNLSIDVALSLFSLTVLSLALESFIRRRETHKP